MRWTFQASADREYAIQPSSPAPIGCRGGGHLRTIRPFGMARGTTRSVRVERNRVCLVLAYKEAAAGRDGRRNVRSRTLHAVFYRMGTLIPAPCSPCCMAVSGRRLHRRVCYHRNVAYLCPPDNAIFHPQVLNPAHVRADTARLCRPNLEPSEALPAGGPDSSAIGVPSGTKSADSAWGAISHKCALRFCVRIFRGAVVILLHVGTRAVFHAELHADFVTFPCCRRRADLLDRVGDLPCLAAPR